MTRATSSNDSGASSRTSSTKVLVDQLARAAQEELRRIGRLGALQVLADHVDRAQRVVARFDRAGRARAPRPRAARRCRHRLRPRRSRRHLVGGLGGVPASRRGCRCSVVTSGVQVGRRGVADPVAHQLLQLASRSPGPGPGSRAAPASIGHAFAQHLLDRSSGCERHRRLRGSSTPSATSMSRPRSSPIERSLSTSESRRSPSMPRRLAHLVQRIDARIGVAVVRQGMQLVPVAGEQAVHQAQAFRQARAHLRGACRRGSSRRRRADRGCARTGFACGRERRASRAARLRDRTGWRALPAAAFVHLAGTRSSYSRSSPHAFPGRGSSQLSTMVNRAGALATSASAVRTCSSQSTGDLLLLERRVEATPGCAVKRRSSYERAPRRVTRPSLRKLHVVGMGKKVTPR